MIELYRGSINTWECDEMGHMNVRFYVAKMMEGLVELAHAAGLAHAFRERAQSTLRPRDQHIRFIEEAHAGAPFTMTGCVLEVSENPYWSIEQIRARAASRARRSGTWVRSMSTWRRGRHSPGPARHVRGWKPSGMNRQR